MASGVLPVNGQAADDASITIEDVLELYAEAKAARERGDFEGAVAYLDEAYAALLRLRIPADSP